MKRTIYMSALASFLVIAPNYAMANSKSAETTATFTRHVKLSKAEAQNATRAAARNAGIPVNLFFNLVRQESGFNSKALSPKGAYGLAQLMPATAKALGVNPYNPIENLEGGARYLKKQYNRFGSWKLALAAYNAGPARVDEYNGVPPFRETQNYVKVILGKTNGTKTFKPPKNWDVFYNDHSANVFSKSSSKNSISVFD